MDGGRRDQVQLSMIAQTRDGLSCENWEESSSLTYIWINISHTITTGLFIVVDSQNITHKLCGIKYDTNICIKFTDYKWPNLLGWIEYRFFCGGQLNCESVSSINSPNQ